MVAVLSRSSSSQTHGEVVVVAWWPVVGLVASSDGGWVWSFGRKIPKIALVTTRVATLVMRNSLSSTPKRSTRYARKEVLEFGTKSPRG